MEFRRLTPYVFAVFALFYILSLSANVTALTVIDVENHPEVNTTPIVLSENNNIQCARVHVSGLSRLKLGSYSNAHKFVVIPSPQIQRKSHKRIQICLHKNATLGLCQCENSNWEGIQDGTWSSEYMSPYGDKYIDVKFVHNLSGSVSVSIKQEVQRWRLLCLFTGLFLLPLAPAVSGWVPFYYSSSMFLGVIVLFLIVLFQGMKLLPTGRKTAMYSIMSGLAIGAGSFLLKRLLFAFANSLLVNFGIRVEMHNTMLVFGLLGIVLPGAGFGYWFVRKYVVDQGKVDVGIAQFIKWTMWIIGMTFISQSTIDTPLAIATLLCVLAIYKSFPFMCNALLLCVSAIYKSFQSIRLRGLSSITKRLSRSGGTMNSPKNTSWKKSIDTSPERSNSNSPVEDILSPLSRLSTLIRETYYSSCHTMMKKLTEDERKESTKEFTKHSVAELVKSPAFQDWMIKNEDRIQVHRKDTSEETTGDDTADESTGSGSGLVS